MEVGAKNAAAKRGAGPELKVEEDAALLNVRAVADLLDCSPRHVYRMADAGKMPRPLKLGQLVRWKRRGGPTDSIEGWIAAGCPSVGPAKGTP